MNQTSIAPYPRFRAFYPGTGNPLAGGLLWTLQPGTSGTGFLKATFTDSTGLTQNSNPVILDANGEVLQCRDKYLLAELHGRDLYQTGILHRCRPDEHTFLPYL